MEEQKKRRAERKGGTYVPPPPPEPKARPRTKGNAAQLNRRARETDITESYRRILGRDPDPKGMESYLKSGMSVHELEKSLASSAEAGRRYQSNWDAAQKVTPGMVGDQYRLYVDAWRQKNPGKELGMGTFTREVKHWENLTNGNVEGYRAFLDGDIKEVQRGAQTGLSTYYVTQKAIDRMGGKVDLRSNTTGQAFITPEGAEWTTTQGRRKAVGSENGMSYFFSAEKETSGLAGVFSEVDTVLNDWLPKELVAIADITGAAAGILGGSRQKRIQRENLAGITGLKEQEVGFVQRAADTVAQVVATAYGVGAQYAAVSNTSRVAAGEQNVLQGLVNTATAFATTGEGNLAQRAAGESKFVYGATKAAVRSAGSIVSGNAMSAENFLLNTAIGGVSGAAYDTEYQALANAGTNAVMGWAQGYHGTSIIASAAMGFAGGTIGGNVGGLVSGLGGTVAGAMEASRRSRRKGTRGTPATQPTPRQSYYSPAYYEAAVNPAGSSGGGAVIRGRSRTFNEVTP